MGSNTPDKLSEAFKSIWIQNDYVFWPRSATNTSPILSQCYICKDERCLTDRQDCGWVICHARALPWNKSQAVSQQYRENIPEWIRALRTWRSSWTPFPEASELGLLQKYQHPPSAQQTRRLLHNTAQRAHAPLYNTAQQTWKPHAQYRTTLLDNTALHRKPVHFCTIQHRTKTSTDIPLHGIYLQYILYTKSEHFIRYLLDLSICCCSLEVWCGVCSDMLFCIPLL